MTSRIWSHASQHNRHIANLTVMYRVRSLARLLALALLATSFAAPTAHAGTSADQKRKVEQLARELADLHDRIAQIDESYGAVVDEQDALAEQMAQSQVKVDAGRAQYEQLQETLNNIAVNRFVGAGEQQLSPLFSSAAAFTRAQEMQALSAIAYDEAAADADTVESFLRDYRRDLETLQRQQAKATQLQQSLEQQRQQGEALIAEYEQKAAEAQAKYGELVAQEAERLREQQAIAAAQAAQGNAGGGNTGGGVVTPPRGGGNTGGGNTGGGNTGGGNTGGGGGSSTPSIPMPPPPSGRAGAAVAAAQRMLGVPYRAFEATPERGFDCSGLTMWAWAQAGVRLPHQSRQQYNSNPKVPRDQVQPGDLVFFYNPISHVGMYIGGGLMIDSPHTGAVVRVRAIKWEKVVGIARPG